MNGNVAVAGSETVLLDLDPLSATNLRRWRVSARGKLYVAVGENAVSSNSRTRSSNLLGKMLR